MWCGERGRKLIEINKCKFDFSLAERFKSLQILKGIKFYRLLITLNLEA